MKTISEYKADLLDRLGQLIGAGKERELFPINVEEIDRNFEMVNSSNEIYIINENDVTYDDGLGEDWESSFDDLAVEDIAELIDIMETVIEDHDVEDEKTQKRISD